MDSTKGAKVFFGYLLVGLLVVFISACSRKFYFEKVENRLYPISNNLPVDSGVLKFYRPYKQRIDSQMNAVIAFSEIEIERKRPEGTLNNLVADAMAEVARQANIKFDFAHTNFKGLRISLPSGPIRTYKIYELMPFENYLVTVKLKGEDVLALFNYMAKEGGDPVSNASFHISSGVASRIKIDGQPFDPVKTYTVLTSDYMANGGDGASVYLKALERKESSIKLRDAILKYLQQETSLGRKIHPKVEGRIISDKPIEE